MDGTRAFVRARSLSAALLVPMVFSAFSPFSSIASAWTTPNDRTELHGDPRQEESEAESSDDVYLHTVQWPQESLSLIAAWYTGDWKNWVTLAACNGGDGSDAVRVNEVILIPKAIMTTTVPMPASFVGFRTPETGRRTPSRKVISKPRQAARVHGQKRSKPMPAPEEAPRPAPSSPAEPLELFGPKE